MIVKVLKNGKNHLEIELENLTIAELVRNELWEDSAISVAAWKKSHPTKNPVLVVKTTGKAARKVLIDCLERIGKNNKKMIDEAKKSLKK
ncbi:MAG: hypothetical protein KKE23_02630 [Nanoarchaeota archaeon]|nr:hypothetical protein [Nanoarchaeota archaeon]